MNNNKLLDDASKLVDDGNDDSRQRRSTMRDVFQGAKNSASFTNIVNVGGVPGILRKPSIAKRQCPVISVPPNVTHKPYFFWKYGSLLLIPILGYSLSQLYPSSILLHFIFLCFVFGLVDLIDHDPGITFTPSYADAATLTTMMEQKRLRRVDFANGTKFYRLPKPMSRKQRQSLCETHIPCLTLSDHSTHDDTVSSLLSSDNPTRTTINNHHHNAHDASRATAATPATIATTTTTTTTIDWEATSRLLKSIIDQPRPTHEDSTRDLDFQDARQTESTDSNPLGLSLAENMDPTKKKQNQSPLKHLGSDSAIARLRKAIKPLQEVNRQQ